MAPLHDGESRQVPAATSNVVNAGGVTGLVQAGVITGGVHLYEPARRSMVPPPRQLGSAPSGFVGRVDQLATLDRAVTRIDGAGATAVISAIGGSGGIGKSWLALAWAHRNLARFPDGQLAVDLRGFSSGRPKHATDVLADFLAALGVDRDLQPTDIDARAALYRTHTTGKRMLILLDNAATSDQVVPLLPGGTTCTVLVTSRNRLVSLIDRHGARHLTLDVLPRADAHALLVRRLGVDRVIGEPDAVDALVDLCGRYPLALAITARKAAANPGVPLVEVATELREMGLEMLDHDTDPAASLPAVLSWSLHHLTDTQRTLFGLLGTAPGPDTTLPAVVSLTALPPARARRALSALEEASLIERRPHGRFALHDLVRDYAATTALPDGVRDSALVRVLDFYLQTAHTADRLLAPHRPLVQPGRPALGVHPHPLPDAAAATAWLQAEHATLLSTQRAAADLNNHHVVWHLAWALDTFQRRRGYRCEALTSWQAALEAAAHLPDPVIHSCTRRYLGHACSRLGLHDGAIEYLDRALELAVRHHDQTEQAHTLQALAVARGRRGDPRLALEHARGALRLWRTLNQSTWEASALNLVGWYAARLGEFATAREYCRAALTLQRHHHNPDGAAATLDSLGLIAYLTGDHRQAVDYYHQAITLRHNLGHAYKVANTLDREGHPHSALGNHEQARAVWREALKIYREQGRDSDAERVRRQLDELISPDDATDSHK